MAVHIYAIVPAALQIDPSWRGVHSEPLRLIKHGALALLVSKAAAEITVSRVALERHDRLMRDIAAAAAMLPARFGLLIRDVAEARRLMRTRGPQLRRALRLVRHREQMTLRIDLTSGRAAAVWSHQSRGRAYLRARAAELTIAERPPIRGLLRRLSPLVRAEHRERSCSTAIFYHLIDRGESRTYRATIEALAVSNPEIRISVSGPFPPYAFTGMRSR